MATSAVVNSALQRLVGELARAYAPNGIAINCISPGPVRTARYEALLNADGISGGRADAERRLIKTVPAGRVGEPSEVGALIAFLCSPIARHINGSTVYIDGGQSGAGGI
jgi:3-oxoacyl-[acyl-carrier protein] reductase